MSENDERLKGIFPALVSPYTEYGRVDEEATRRLVRHLISRGVHGFYVGGSTGEGLLQTADERKAFSEVVVDEVGGRLPVVSHVGAPDTDTCIDLTRHAAAIGADAISAVAPFYYRHAPEQVKRHYLDLTEAADIPLIIYHVPELSGTEASVDFFQEMSRVEGVIGVKFTSRDVYELQRVVEACGEDFLVYNGADEVCVAGLLMGASGAIGSTYNIMPDRFVALYEALEEGRCSEAVALQREANEVIHELLEFDVIASVKEVLKTQGFEVGEPRRPIQRLTSEQKATIGRTSERLSLYEEGTATNPSRGVE